jgi:hypothetical protein
MTCPRKQYGGSSTAEGKDFDLPQSVKAGFSSSFSTQRTQSGVSIETGVKRLNSPPSEKQLFAPALIGVRGGPESCFDLFADRSAMPREGRQFLRRPSGAHNGARSEVTRSISVCDARFSATAQHRHPKTRFCEQSVRKIPWRNFVSA